jgi:hypothetical protein
MEVSFLYNEEKFRDHIALTKSHCELCCFCTVDLSLLREADALAERGHGFFDRCLSI